MQLEVDNYNRAKAEALRQKNRSGETQANTACELAKVQMQCCHLNFTSVQPCCTPAVNTCQDCGFIWVVPK